MYKYVILTLLNDVITFLTSLKCNYNGTQVIYTVFFQFQIPIVMQKSFVSPAPWDRGIAELLYFSIFKALLKALHCGAKFVVKFLLEDPSPGVDNNATDICIHHDVLLQGNLGPEQFGQKLDRASFLTNYSGPRVGFRSLSNNNRPTYEGYF